MPVLDKWLREVKEREDLCRLTKADIKTRQRAGLCADCVPYALREEKERLTLLYSIRAHSRGKLHMTKRRAKVTKKTPSGWKTFDVIQPWTMEDQKRLIENHVEEFSPVV